MPQVNNCRLFKSTGQFSCFVGHIVTLLNYFLVVSLHNDSTFVLCSFVPVVAIIDIGSASFKYDMRRLTEILAFPKAWYRRSIVRRLFLGDLSISATYSEGEESSASSLEDEHLLLAAPSVGRSGMSDSR